MSAESSVSLVLLPSVEASLIALSVESFSGTVPPRPPKEPKEPKKPDDSPRPSPPSPGPSPFLL